MKNFKTIFILMIVFVALVLTSCGKKEETTDLQGTADAVEETVDNTVEEATEAATDTFGAMKDEFVTTATETVNTLSGQVGDLIAKKAALPDIAQQPLNKPMKKLTEAKDDMVESLSDLTNSSEGNFEEKKTGFTKSVTTVKDTYNSVLRLF